MTTRSKWVVSSLVHPSDSEQAMIAESLGVQPFLVELLYGRGLKSLESMSAFLDPARYRPALPEVMPNISKTGDRLLDVIKNRESVLVYADLDADGVCGAALISDALKLQGVDVHVHISQRRGVLADELQGLLEKYLPHVLVIVDIGSSHDYAKYSVDTIILDHHRLPDEIPQVYGFVNPQLLPASHPLRHLSSVGIAYLLAQYVYGKLGEERHLERFLDLVALGLVADRVDLVDDTRFLAQRGLLALKKSTRPGVKALAQAAGIELERVTADDVALQLAPRINSFGRLADPMSAFRLMTTRNYNEAQNLALEANALNQKSQLIRRQMLAAARDQIANDPSLLNWTALTLENAHWDGRMMGSAAGQLADELMRPVALLIPDEERGVARGSVRSYGGYDVVEALAAMQESLINFGGHAGAAGFSMNLDSLPAFRRRFSNALDAQQPDKTANALTIDAPLPLDQINPTLAHEIERLAPFGAGNPRPVFVSRSLKRLRSAKIGRADQHRRLTLRDENDIDYSVLWWNSSHLDMPEGTFDLAYQVAPVFRDGSYEIQLTLIDWQQTAPPDDIAQVQPDLIDCREQFDLDAIRSTEKSLMIWAEGYSQKGSPGLPLSELSPADALLIYTAPPHPDHLQRALEKVRPQRIYVHAASPPFDDTQKLLEGVAALLRAAQAQFNGRIKISQIAERTAHTPDTIKLALEALGDSIHIEWISKFTIHVEKAEQPPRRVNAPELAAAIAETSAYRRFVQRTDLENLLGSTPS